MRQRNLGATSSAFEKTGDALSDCLEDGVTYEKIADIFTSFLNKLLQKIYFGSPNLKLGLNSVNFSNGFHFGHPCISGNCSKLKFNDPIEIPQQWDNQLCDSTKKIR